MGGLTWIGNLTFVPRRALCFVVTSTTLAVYWSLGGYCWYKCNSQHDSWHEAWFPHFQGTVSRFGLNTTERAPAWWWWADTCLVFVRGHLLGVDGGRVDMNFEGGWPSTYRLWSSSSRHSNIPDSRGYGIGHGLKNQEAHTYKLSLAKSRWQSGWIHKNTDNVLGKLPTRLQHVEHGWFQVWNPARGCLIERELQSSARCS